MINGIGYLIVCVYVQIINESTSICHSVFAPVFPRDANQQRFYNMNTLFKYVSFYLFNPIVSADLPFYT